MADARCGAFAEVERVCAWVRLCPLGRLSADGDALYDECARAREAASPCAHTHTPEPMIARTMLLCGTSKNSLDVV